MPTSHLHAFSVSHGKLFLSNEEFSCTHLSLVLAPSMDLPLLQLALTFVLTYVPLLTLAVCVTFMLVRMMPAGDRQQVQFESGFTFTTPLIEEERRGPAKRQRKQRVVPKMGEHSTGTRASITNFFAGRRGATPAYVSTSTSSWKYE